MKRLNYRGYEAIAEYDPERQIFHGNVTGIKDVITFQAATQTELYQALAGSVDDYLAFSSETNEPSQPFSA